MADPDPRGAHNHVIQAGLLTLGSPYLPRLPISLSTKQWQSAAFVPNYSGGPVPDFHGVPCSAPKEHLNIFVMDTTEKTSGQPKSIAQIHRFPSLPEMRGGGHADVDVYFNHPPTWKARPSPKHVHIVQLQSRIVGNDAQ